MGIRIQGVDDKLGYQTGLGLFTTYHIPAPTAAAADVAKIVASVLPIEGSWTTLTIAAQPDTPRTLNLELEVDATVADLTVVFRVHGMTSYGERVTEDKTVIGNGTVVETDYAYREVYSIQTNVTVPTDIDATDRIRVGHGPSHGSPIKFGATADVIGAWERVQDPGTPSEWAKLTVVITGLGTTEVLVDTQYHTMEFGDVPATGQEYLVHLQSSYSELNAR